MMLGFVSLQDGAGLSRSVSSFSATSWRMLLQFDFLLSVFRARAVNLSCMLPLPF